VAFNDGDYDKANALEAEMLELEERSREMDKKRTSSFANIAFINERNRRRNHEDLSQAICEEMRADKANKEKGEWDPFTRRLTKPSIPFKVASEIKEEATELTPDFDTTSTYTGMSESLMKFAETPYVDASEYERHNFEINIEIDLMNLPTPPEMVTIQPRGFVPTPNPMPYGWRKWEEYKKKRGFI
jgi:hypothetical protein